KAVIADVQVERADELVEELGDNVMFVLTDVTSENAAQNAVDQAIEKFGKVNGLVNCEGIEIGERTVRKRGAHNLDSFKKVMNINIIVKFNMIRLAAEKMQENEPYDDGERGVIINTASVAAFDGQIGQAAYSASKGAVAGMTLPIARDLSGSGIRVMTIAPGLFETPLFAQLP